MNKMRQFKFLKKYHKWLSLGLTLFIFLFSVSGIILNHRELFSSIDVNRNYLADEYAYSNWNKAAVNGACSISDSSALIYGNVGVWKTNDDFKSFSDFNNGLPKGMDSKKISKLLYTKSGELYAGTLFGLYSYNFEAEKWEKQSLPTKETRVVDVIEAESDVFVLTRSHLIKKINDEFIVQKVNAPEGFDGKISLFKTLWQLHSGEAFGMTGKLLVDLLALVFIFLIISGWIWFLFPKLIKRLRKNNKSVGSQAKILKSQVKWHKKIGLWTCFFLVFLTFTGMFLRPPLLIAIVSSKVSPIPYTHLDNENPWFDMFRKITYDSQTKKFILASKDALYYSLSKEPTDFIKFKVQAPISVMGTTVLESQGDGNYLIASFSGVFQFRSKQNLVLNYLTKREHFAVKRMGPPISSHPISGYLKTNSGDEILFDYNLGAGNLTSHSGFVSMPSDIQNQPMSLWNLALEVHTARIYNYIFGSLYILLIPILGLIILFILISGVIPILFKQRTNK